MRLRALSAAWVAIALLAGGWAWSQGLPGPFHFDDYVTPLNDPASHSLADWRQHLTVTLRPTTKLSYALEADAGIGAEPAPRRAVSIVLHVASAMLLFLLMAQLAPRVAPWGAALLSMLWFLHPVHADSVLLISGRSALLAGLCLMASLLAMERSRYWLSGLLFAFACLSRETALAGLLPLAVLAASQPGISLRSTLRQLAPALLAGAAIVAWIVTTPRYLDLAEYSFLGRPFWGSLFAQTGAVPVGLGLLLNPTALSIDYGIPLPRGPSDVLFPLGVALYLAAAAGIVMFFRRSRAAAVGLALWLAALLPTQSVVPKLDALTNRPLSLALAGLLLAAAPLLAALVQRARSVVAGGWRVAMPASALALCTVLAVATAERSALFQSELDLWRDAASKSRSNPRPHLQFAQLLKAEGRNEEAWAAVVAARDIDPFSSQVARFARVYDTKEVQE